MFGHSAVELVIPFLALADGLLRLPCGVDLRLLPPRPRFLPAAGDFGAVPLHLFVQVVEIGLYPTRNGSVFFKVVLAVVAVMPRAVLAVSDLKAPVLRAGPFDLDLSKLRG